MMIDLTATIKREDFISDHPLIKMGHIGTHLDLMGREFPIEYVKRRGKIVDISGIKNREIEIDDIKIEINENDFVIFKTDNLVNFGYFTEKYIENSAELSDGLVEFLINKRISLVGVDAVGVQNSEKHVAADQHFADNNIFVVENLLNIDVLHKEARDGNLTIYCSPLHLVGTTALPCRVVAEI
jgi:kynurenine formamidase